MARPTYPSDKQDQFMLRMPNGLRDRIKARAEKYGRSMNAEIVRVLLEEFPEPFPLAERVDELIHLFSAFRKVRGYEKAIDGLSEAVLEAVSAMASGRVPEIDEATRAELQKAMVQWSINRMDRTKAARERSNDVEGDE